MPDITFNKLHNVNNPTSIHGIYPYRGKIASIEAKLIIEQLPKGTVLLDPFCGSGTIVFEGICNNLKVFGIDNNPLAIWIAKGKVDALKYSLEESVFSFALSITNDLYKPLPT